MSKKSKTEPKTDPAEQEAVKAIKALDHDFKCRDFQYEVGKSYEISGALKICERGFHACDANPLDAWNFYPVVNDDGKLTRYAATSHTGPVQREKDEKHSKIASAKITIDAELHLSDFLRSAVSWMIDATKNISSKIEGAEENSGNYAQIGSSGDSAKIGSSGDSAQIGSSGYSAQIGSSGYSAQIGSSGDYAKIGSSGNSAQIGSSGDSAQIGSSGNYAKIVVEGKDSVVASAGPGTSVKGAAGTWISIAEYNSEGKCVGFATGCIGQDGLLPEVSYIAKNGKLVAD